MALRITRRDILAGFGASLLLCPSATRFAEAAENDEPLFASAFMDSAQRYGMAIIDRDGHILSTCRLPGRGHSIAGGRKASWLVTFARRPGNFALAIDVHKRISPILFKSAPDTHFSGHGTFSADNTLVFATENAFERETGVIGIFDATNAFRRICEIPSFGIGPHEIILMPDGKTLCVANGGILTHPSTGRARLNLHNMRSSVAFIDSLDGRLIARFTVPGTWQRLSLRHMAIDHHHAVWFGGQYEGNSTDQVPLIAKVTLDKGLDFPGLSPDLVKNLVQYTGSVACSEDGKTIAVSSPKGSIITFIDTASHAITHQERINQVCGLAWSAAGLVHTSLTGAMNTKLHSVKWDNHISMID